MHIGELERLIFKHLDSIYADVYLQLLLDRMPADEVDDTLLESIKEKLKQDWQEITEDKYLIYTSQFKLKKRYVDLINDFVKHRIMDHNERSELFARHFEKHYLKKNPNAPDFNTLMAIVLACGRLLGYPSQDEIEYPLSRIPPLSAKTLTENRAAFVKRQQIITHMAVLHYLLHTFCTAEQKEILFEAIGYRKNTSTEEQRAERRLLAFLINNVEECKAFFAHENGYIDFNPIRELAELKAIEDYIPESRSAFIDKISFSECIYLFLKVLYKTRHANGLYFQKEAVRFIEAEFNGQDVQCFQASLSFAKKLLKESERLTSGQAVFQKAIQIFCLKNYIKIRQSQHNGMLFSFSPETKITAARKLIQRLNDEAVELSLKESLATKEGRLGEIFMVFSKQEASADLYKDKQPDRHRF